MVPKRTKTLYSYMIFDQKATIFASITGKKNFLALEYPLKIQLFQCLLTTKFFVFPSF